MISTVAFATDETNLPLEDTSLIDSMDDINLINEDSEMHNYSNELYDNIKNEDVYEFQNQVTITDAINGNVYAMGKDVKLDKAIIYGNVFVMAENVEFADVEIYGSIYIIAQIVNFVGTTNDILSRSE